MKLRWLILICLLLILAVLVGAAGQSVPMGAMPRATALVVSDNFPGSSLSANWTVVTDSFVVSSGIAGGVTSSKWSTAYWSHDAFPANQYSQMVPAAGAGGSNFWVGASARVQPTTDPTTPYGYMCGGGGGVWAGSVFLYRMNGGSSTLLTTESTTGAPNGSTLKISAVGSTISCYVNGTQVLTTTDSTYATGQPGFTEATNGTSPMALGASTWQAGSL